MSSHAKRDAQSERITESEAMTLEALRLTQHSAGWLLSIAEASSDPDARAAARWLDRLGGSCYRLASRVAVDTTAWIDADRDAGAHPPQ